MGNMHEQTRPNLPAGSGPVAPPANAHNTQVGGDHYKKLAIQPSHFTDANKLLFNEGNVIKLVTRHQDKGKAQDILKAMQYLEFILERDYPETLLMLQQQRRTLAV